VLPIRDIPVYCELFPCFHDDQPSYAALSYVWGDASDTQTIHVNSSEVEVTKNLQIALEYLWDDNTDLIV
jgi:hypothetical protein